MIGGSHNISNYYTNNSRLDGCDAVRGVLRAGEGREREEEEAMRIIDADALIKQIKSSSAYNDYEWSMYADGFIEDIDSAPTIEPKRGKWIDNGFVVICSECGIRVVGGNLNFCPNCGCAMRKEGE